MSPIVDGIEREYRGRLTVVYVSMDHRDGKQPVREHRAVGAPTVLSLDSAGNQVNVLRGWLPLPLTEQSVEGLMAR